MYICKFNTKGNDNLSRALALINDIY